MTLVELVERYAQLEKRAVGFYRGLADRFAANQAAARLWLELSNTEASHFALLELAQDWITMAKGAGGMPAVTPEAVASLDARHEALERAAEADGLSLEAAVGLSVDWEELELPRIVELSRHLPPPAQGRVMAGMVAEGAEHYRLLTDLVKAAGGAGHAGRVAALERAARDAIG